MLLSFTEKKNIRKNFGKLKDGLSIPNLIEVQKNSYKELTEFKEIVDQKRIDDILHNLSIIAEKKCLPKSMIIDIWRSMIKGFINYEKENFDKIKKD